MKQIPISKDMLPVVAISMILCIAVILVIYFRERNALDVNSNISSIRSELEKRHGDIEIRKYVTTSMHENARTDEIVFSLKNSDTLYHASVETDRNTDKFTIISDDCPYGAAS